MQSVALISNTTVSIMIFYNLFFKKKLQHFNKDKSSIWIVKYYINFLYLYAFSLCLTDFIGEVFYRAESFHSVCSGSQKLQINTGKYFPPLSRLPSPPAPCGPVPAPPSKQAFSVGSIYKPVHIYIPSNGLLF